MTMRGILTTLLIGVALAWSAPASAAYQSGPGPHGKDLRHCSGKVRTFPHAYAWRIRVKRITCDRFAQLVGHGGIPEDHGFRCKYTERFRGIGVDCRKPSEIGVRRLLYLDSGN